MKKWFPINENDLSPFRFMPDGAFFVGPLRFKSSAQVKNSNIGGFLLDGDGTHLSITDERQGLSLTVRFDAGKWECDHEIHKSDDSPEPPQQNPPPPASLSTSPPTPPPIRRGFDFYAYRIAAVLALAIVFLYLIVPKLEPLARLLPMNLKDAKASADHADRQDAVKAAHESAAQALKALDKANDSLDKELRAFLGSDFEALQTLAGRPRELDLAILENNPAAQAWTTIKNAYVTNATRERHRQTLNTIAKRIDDATATDADRKTLNDLAADLTAATATLEAADREIRPLETAVWAARQKAERIRAEERKP